MILPKLFYQELKRIKKVNTNEGSRIKRDVIRKKGSEEDKAEVLRPGMAGPRFRKLNTPMGPSKFIPLSTLHESVQESFDLMPSVPPAYEDYENMNSENLQRLQEEVREMAEQGSLTLDEAASMVEEAYGPEKIFVWLVKIIVFNGFMLGTLGFAMSLPSHSPSLPSFTLWASCTVACASLVTLFGCIFIAFARKTVEIRLGTFMRAINAGLSVIASLLVIWLFYGLLTIGKKDRPTVMNNLSKLLWPVTFPLQGTPFVIGASFLILMFLLFLVTSYKSTPINSSNTMFFNHGFLFMTAFTKAFIQIMSNRGYVVCDMRSNPWASNANTIYSLWNRSYAIWVTINSLLAISFALSLIGDLRLDRGWVKVENRYFPASRVLHCGLIASAYIAFMLFDVTSSQGKNDIIDSNLAVGTTSKKEKAFHTLFNFALLGMCGLVALVEIDVFNLLFQDPGRGSEKKQGRERFNSKLPEYKKEQ